MTAKSADWARISGRLAAVQHVNVPGLYWFALSDGSYWSVAQGRATGNLSDRAYWPQLMAGHLVLGDLVASKATGKSTAIVAVPVRNTTGLVVGAVGSSIYLDSLSLLIKREIDLQPGLLFFSVDATPIGALQDDPDQIFLDPYNLGEPELERAIREMLTREEGVVNYHFRGKARTVLLRRDKALQLSIGRSARASSRILTAPPIVRSRTILRTMNRTAERPRRRRNPSRSPAHSPR